MKIGILSSTLILLLSGCSSMGNMLNPFYDPPAPQALLGDANDKAISGGSNADDSARKALESMASYRRAQEPQPVNPVIQPAVVRLMWVPDHLNKNGDLVPAHYYYLKVLKDRWAVTDAFELESQLSAGTPANASLPYVPVEEMNQ
jgi:hypothetical protein